MVAEGIEGGSWNGVRNNITLPRLRSIRKYWNIHPPASWLQAIQMGYKAPDPSEAKKKQQDSLGTLVNMFGLRAGKKVSM